MREGRTHCVCWAKSGDGYEFWLRNNPQVRLKTSVIDDDLGLQLELLVIEAGIDCEPLLTFDPPLPTLPADEPWIADLALATSNAYAWLAGTVADYYEGGACSACDRPIGPRNDRPLVMNAAPEGDLCFAGGGFAARPIICSERLMERLLWEELAGAEWRPIDRGSRARRRYFECRPHIMLQPCAVRGRSGGWRCALCGYTCISSMTQDSDLHTFVARADLPHPRPPLFAVGDHAWQKLVLPMSRAASLLRGRGGRGVFVESLGVVGPEHVDPQPVLKLCEGRRATGLEFREDGFAIWGRISKQMVSWEAVTGIAGVNDHVSQRAVRLVFFQGDGIPVYVPEETTASWAYLLRLLDERFGIASSVMERVWTPPGFRNWLIPWGHAPPLGGRCWRCGCDLPPGEIDGCPVCETSFRP